MMRTRKNDIQLFQAPSFGLWKEEVYAWDKAGVEDGEHGIRVVLKVGERGWGNHDDEEVRDPVGASRECVCLDSDAQVGDFGRVEPGHS